MKKLFRGDETFESYGWIRLDPSPRARKSLAPKVAKAKSNGNKVVKHREFHKELDRIFSRELTRRQK